MYKIINKDYTNTIDRDEIKEVGNITSTTDDKIIQRLGKVATDYIENLTNKDISINDYSYHIYDFDGDSIRVNKSNYISVSAITKKDGSSVTGYTVKEYLNYFLIELEESVTDDEITVYFRVGYSAKNDIPTNFLQAICVTAIDLYDRPSSVTLSNIKFDESLVKNLIKSEKKMIVY